MVMQLFRSQIRPMNKSSYVEKSRAGPCFKQPTPGYVQREANVLCLSRPGLGTPHADPPAVAKRVGVKVETTQLVENNTES